jgi:hypothetical protein
LSFYRRRARRVGVPNGHGGTVTVIQRFGGGINLNVHLHTLALDYGLRHTEANHGC